ncbi:MAG: hypothetical protein IKQ17_13910, partial [Kiritimatiellae bacterium]|nr:hypothetical protein [Kiritimatiellia bacterium]
SDSAIAQCNVTPNPKGFSSTPTLSFATERTNHSPVVTDRQSPVPSPFQARRKPVARPCPVR